MTYRADRRPFRLIASTAMLSALPPVRRVDRNKVEEYLLHPIKGRGKAAFFEAFGFSIAD